HPLEATRAGLRPRPEARDARQVLGAATPAALLAPAVLAARQHRPRPEGQRTDALRTADLVARDAERVGAQRAAVDGDLAGRLDGVHVQPAVRPAHDLGGL